MTHTTPLNATFEAPSRAHEQICVLLMRTALLAALARLFPRMPLSTFCHVNAELTDEGPCAIMDRDRLKECLEMFGRDGWALEADYLKTLWTARKMVSGVRIEIMGLETDAATSIRGQSL